MESVLASLANAIKAMELLEERQVQLHAALREQLVKAASDRTSIVKGARVLAGPGHLLLENFRWIVCVCV